MYERPTQKEYDRMMAENGAIEMIRPFYNHQNSVNPQGVTVLICQGNKRFLTQLCITSLLRFYPDIQILVVNGSPDDFDSTNYLEYTSLKNDNIEVWEWNKTPNSHGVMMDSAIRKRIKTEHVLLLDNDTIIERGGWIEGMMNQLQDPNWFATGTLMVVSEQNDSCGLPQNDADILRHAHPSCALIKKSMYMGFRPATDHGAPLCYTMADAKKKGLTVGSYPVDQFVSHLSGASWTKPRTIWSNDHDVMMRPFVTFIVGDAGHMVQLYNQTDTSFDIVVTANWITDNVVIHGQQPVDVNNCFLDLRYKVTGEYVCYLSPTLIEISENFVTELRKQIVEQGIPDRINIGGLECVKREHWQETDCLTLK